MSIYFSPLFIYVCVPGISCYVTKSIIEKRFLENLLLCVKRLEFLVHLGFCFCETFYVTIVISFFFFFFIETLSLLLLMTCALSNQENSCILYVYAC